MVCLGLIGLIGSIGLVYRAVRGCGGQSRGKEGQATWEIFLDCICDEAGFRKIGIKHRKNPFFDWELFLHKMMQVRGWSEAKADAKRKELAADTSNVTTTDPRRTLNGCEFRRSWWEPSPWIPMRKDSKNTDFRVWTLRGPMMP